VTSTNTALPVSIEQVRQAAERIGGQIHRTPLVRNRSIKERAGLDLRLKCENLQRAGSFKIRGALNALSSLTPEERSRGVVAFSSGNHAQGVALAARLLGMKATIVMPQGSVRAKVEATAGYGATVVQSGVTESTRGQVAREIAEKTGALIIPPFDDERIIAGAGTVGLEIIEEWPEVENILVPLGGGGLLSGVATAGASAGRPIAVYGVEPAAGNDGQQSFRSGSIVQIDPPQTIADGARTTALGQRNFAIIRQHVRDILTIEDEELLEVVRYAIYRTKLLIEPTGALALAAVLLGKVKLSGPTAVVISGGNIDLSLLGRSNG
jgi:threonine dehydratase